MTEMLWCVVTADSRRYGSAADCMDWLGVLGAQRVKVIYVGPCLAEDG